MSRRLYEERHASVKKREPEDTEPEISKRSCEIIYERLPQRRILYETCIKPNPAVFFSKKTPNLKKIMQKNWEKEARECL